MKVCVYGSSSSRINKSYLDECFELCKMMAERGHSLVYGAGSDGVMGASARGFHAGKGYVHGIIPKFFEDNGYEAVYLEADRLDRVESMAERKTAMENECDAFVVAPGGIGTLEEFFETLTLKQLGRHNKAIVIFNVLGSYDGLYTMLENLIRDGFLKPECRTLYTFASTKEEVINALESYTGERTYDMFKN